MDTTEYGKIGSGYRTNLKALLRIRIGDPGSGIRCLFDPWIRDPGWVKSKDSDPGSGMTNPDHTYFL
jgi:hypothetical protein